MNIAALLSSEVPPKAVQPGNEARGCLPRRTERVATFAVLASPPQPLRVALSINDAPLVPATCTRVVLLRSSVVIGRRGAGESTVARPPSADIDWLDEWTIGGAELQV